MGDYTKKSAISQLFSNQQQTLTKQKNAVKGRFIFNGDPNQI